MGLIDSYYDSSFQLDDFVVVTCFEKGSSMLNKQVLLLTCALLAFLTVDLPGQSIFSTLTGVVADPAGAVVPGAKVTLRDEQSLSARDSVTNSDGYYTFASVPVGTYSLTIELKGFEIHRVSGI